MNFSPLFFAVLSHSSQPYFSSFVQRPEVFLPNPLDLIGNGIALVFLNKTMRRLVMGEATPPRARFAPFMAEYLLRTHQIFMLALAQSRAAAKQVAQVLAVSQPPP